MFLLGDHRLLPFLLLLFTPSLLRSLLLAVPRVYPVFIPAGMTRFAGKHPPASVTLSLGVYLRYQHHSSASPTYTPEAQEHSERLHHHRRETMTLDLLDQKGPLDP